MSAMAAPWIGGPQRAIGRSPDSLILSFSGGRTRQRSAATEAPDQLQRRVRPLIVSPACLQLSENLWLEVAAGEDAFLEASSVATPDLEASSCRLNGDSARVDIGVRDWAAAEATR